MLRLLRLYRFTRQDLRLLWFALRHHRRPIWLWPAALLLLFYAIEPFNLAIPLMGVIDDFVLVPLALHLILKFLPWEIRASFAARPGLIRR